VDAPMVPLVSGAGAPPAGFPRRRPATKIATMMATAAMPIRTQAHHGRPPLSDSEVVGVVCVA
jgi:hypothetical protein